MSKNHFIGMLVTLLALIFSANPVKANGQQGARKMVKASLISATPISLPHSNTKDTSSPEIRPTGSFSQVETSLSVKTNYILVYLFEITFQKTYSADPQPQIDIALNGFFLTLFSDFIAPNAP
jgi:hypothetical protein